jgi:hypothetical protein
MLESTDPATFLIEGDQRRRREGTSKLLDQRRRLSGTFQVSREQDDPGGRQLTKPIPSLRVQARARKTDHQNPARSTLNGHGQPHAARTAIPNPAQHSGLGSRRFADSARDAESP